MKRYWNKLICCLLCLAMLTGCAAAGLQQNTAANEKSAARQTAVKYEPTAGASSASDGKDETVYVLTDAGGAVKNVIVTDRLGNPAGGETIADVFAVRSPLYDRWADVTVDCVGCTPEQVIEKILDAVR